MKRSNRDPLPIQKVLTSILARRQPEGTRQLDLARTAIRGALPERFSQRVTVDQITKATLVLAIDSSSALSELRAFYDRPMLDAVKAVPGLEALTTIRYKLGALDGK